MERHTRSYLQLLKPGITLSNTLAAVAGFCLAASTRGFALDVFGAVVLGVSSVIAGACVLNNMLDRRLDARMKRTAKREVASGSISLARAGLFAGFLLAVGFGLLAAGTNALTTMLGGLAVVWYVVIYGWAKRTTPLSTLIGGVAGALPPVAGYTALTNQFDTVALLLFAVLFIWQMPHFYAIAMFRGQDYAAAGLPTWLARYGVKSTKRQVMIFIALFAICIPFFTVLGATGVAFSVVMVPLALYWLAMAARNYRRQGDEAWARQQFGISLIVLLGLCAMLAVGGYAP